MKVNLPKIRHLLSKKKNPAYAALETFLIKKLKYYPKNSALFLDAFTHKSYSNTRENVASNERLEYLGDTVIDLIVAEYLYDRFPTKDEGYLTKVKAKIVNRKMLSYIAGELQLEELIRYRKGRSDTYTNN